MKNTSYREMLRDRLPSTIGLALIWCRAKERWLDHVYYSFINIYKDQSERYNATKVVLGMKKGKVHLDFHKTIDWDNLTEEETLYWTRVEHWVNWFRKQMLYIEQTYSMYSKRGWPKENIIRRIQDEHLVGYDRKIGEKLATFLYNNLSKD